MIEDPVVQEIRRHAAKLAQECDGDVAKFAQRLRVRQQANAARVVRRADPLRRPTRPQQDS